MKKISKYIIVFILCALQMNVYAQCPGGASWFNTPVNGTLKDSGRIQVLDTVNVSSTNPTIGSFNAGRPMYATNSLTWAGNPYESITVIRGGGIGATTTFKLKTAVDSNIMHFRISDIRGDGFNAETQRIYGYNNGVLVSATANDAINGASFTAPNLITGGASTTSLIQSSIRIFFNGPVDSVVIRSNGFVDFVIIDLAARCDVILARPKINLTAKSMSGEVQLKWKVEGEADRIEIERADDKNTWTLLTTSRDKLDQFSDRNPLPGMNYYRIKVIESSGNSTYSEVVQVKQNNRNNIATLIYPNPFQNAINCSSREKIISYKLSSATGNVILSKKIAGLNNFSEQLPFSLSQGWYYITLFFQNGEQRSFKLFKAS